FSARTERWRDRETEGRREGEKERRREGEKETGRRRDGETKRLMESITWRPSAISAGPRALSPSLAHGLRCHHGRFVLSYASRQLLQLRRNPGPGVWPGFHCRR